VSSGVKGSIRRIKGCFASRLLQLHQWHELRKLEIKLCWQLFVATVSCLLPRISAIIETTQQQRHKLMSIQQRRLEQGWSQEELARHSGLSTRTIQRIESGQKAGLESLKCLAAVFETSISTLMQEQTMMNQEKTDQSKQPMIHEIEREAIEFAQSLLNPKKGKKDPLSTIERQAIQYAKNLLSKFGA